MSVAVGYFTDGKKQLGTHAQSGLSYAGPCDCDCSIQID